MNGANPPVSVLLPVRNACVTLEAALRSVARQTAAHYECVIVDDGSSDGSLERARAFAHEDSRFRVLQSRGGLIAALELGLRSCRGAWVARMDADDLMHRNRLASQLEAVRNEPDLVAVGTHVRLFPRDHLSEGMHEYETWLNGIRTREQVRSELFVECPLAHPTLMARRAVLSELGYRDRGWPEDYDLVLRLVLAGHQVGVVPARLHSWRDAATRLSRTHPRYEQPRFVDCKAAFLATHLLGGREDYVLWGYGGTGRALRRALHTLGKQPSHIVELHPGRLGMRIHGAPVIPPQALNHLRGRPVITSVAGIEARRQIRAHLSQLGFRETKDFVCAA